VRIRTIKPEFWTDLKVSSLSYLARLLFIGLWNLADDEGRFKSDPRILKGFIFPVDDTTTVKAIAGALRELSGSTLVVLREIDGEQYGCCPNFRKHQVINKPSKSKLPEFTEDYRSTTVVLPEDSHTEREREREREVEMEGDAGKPESSPSAAEQVIDGKGLGKRIKNPKLSPQQVDDIYAAYPRKEKPRDAKLAIEKAFKLKECREAADWHEDRDDKDNIDMAYEFLLDRTKRYALYCAKHENDLKRNGKNYIPHPATWFNSQSYLIDHESNKHILHDAIPY
jgi:hypothetical protein